MLILLPGALMMSLYQLLTRSFTSDAKQEINIFAAVVALILNVALNFVLDSALRRGGRGGRERHLLRDGGADPARRVRARVGASASARRSGSGASDVDDLVRAARRIAGRMPGLPARSWRSRRAPER